MDIFLSSVLGELTSRSINFVSTKVYNRSLLGVEDRLHKALLRAQVIIDEATGRHITNQAINIQLSMLRDAVHRGYYMLDTYVCQPYEEEAKDQVMRHSSSLSIVNSVKQLSALASRNNLALKKLQVMVDNLSSIIIDANELVLFLTSYPRLYCQPYNMHLQLANCMYDRQIEVQQVINFLLCRQHDSVDELDVMPIVGPALVGKSTLVTHVCKDERVCANFPKILFFHIKGVTDDELAAFRGGCEIKRENLVSGLSMERRFLIVIDLIRNINEDAWSRLYSACKQYAPTGSKIILTSRFDNIVKYGTTQALPLKYLSHEAFWYFFKTLTFGSTDPRMHPRLTHLAMEIAMTQKRSHTGANILARLLQDNFNIHFWCRVLAFLKRFYSRFAEHPSDPLNQNITVMVMRMTTASEEIVLNHWYERFSEEDVPKIKLQDVMYGSVKVHGKFEALAWRSRIPPYYSYVCACEVQEIKTRAMKRKLFMENES